MSDLSLYEKISILQCVDLFAKLDREEIETVGMNSEVVNVKMGTVVFGENSQSSELYIVRDGEVLITKHKDYENDIDLAQYLPIECFGELDLFCAGKRMATAVTVRDSSLLIFPKRGMDFADILQAYPRVSARILYKLLAIIADRVMKVQKLIALKSFWVDGLRKKLYVDKLTGLFNKHFLNDEIKNIFAKSINKAAICIIKPDNFKYLNDTYGHAAGDKVLLLISIFLQYVLRDSDIAIRYWGDEFAVVLMNVDKAESLTKAREIGKALFEINLRDVVGVEGVTIRVSIGISLYPSFSSDVAELVEAAHDKMLLARKKGGNRIMVSG